MAPEDNTADPTSSSSPPSLVYNSPEFFDFFENQSSSTTATPSSILFQQPQFLPTPFPIPPTSLLPNIFSPHFIWPIPPDTPPTPLELRIKFVTESCLFKASTAGIVGGGLGLAFGLFFGGYANAVDKAVDTEGSTLVKVRVGMREAGAAMSSYAKNFARFGFFLSATECFIERFRGRHDLFNPVVGGCITGAGMAASPSQQMPVKARATQMAIGCASLAAFSLAIEKYMEYSSS